MKKLFISSGILFVITLFIWGIYNFAFKKSSSVSQTSKTTSSTTSQNPNVQATIVEKKNNKIVPISKEAVLGATIDKKTEKISFYSALDGTVWQVDSDGSNLMQISSVKLSGLVGVNWSSDKTKVLTNFNKDGKNIFFMYDNIKKAGVQLSGNIDNVVWDSLGGKIVYKYYDGKTKKRSLSVANPDGSAWQTVVDDVPFRRASLAIVPLSSTVSFWNTPSATEESFLQIVSITGGGVKVIFKGRFGGDYLWSPDGSQALVSSVASNNSKTILLGVVDLQGQYRDLGIPTLASKCVWSTDGRTVYYALPGGIPAGVTMPDDYQNKKFITEDTFWKVNTLTGNKERILELNDINGSYDVREPFLSSTENSLFFINGGDGKLYRVAL